MRLEGWAKVDLRWCSIVQSPANEMASLDSLNPIFDDDVPLALPPSPPATDEDRVNAMEEEEARETEYYSGLYADTAAEQNAAAEQEEEQDAAEEQEQDAAEEQEQDAAEEQDADDEQEEEEQEDESTLHEMEKNPLTTVTDSMMCASIWVLVFTLFLAFLLHPAS